MLLKATCHPVSDNDPSIFAMPSSVDVHGKGVARADRLSCLLAPAKEEPSALHNAA
jgi:hypothetical protein